MTDIKSGIIQGLPHYVLSSSVDLETLIPYLYGKYIFLVDGPARVPYSNYWLLQGGNSYVTLSISVCCSFYFVTHKL